MQRNFSSPRLARLLGDTPAADAQARRHDIAQRLSPWVGVFDAVTLHAVHQTLATAEASIPSPAARPATNTTPASRAQGLPEQLQQVRGVLAKAIATLADEAPPELAESSGGRRSRPVIAAESEASAAAPVDFAPYRRRYGDHQRNMELMIEPLRAHVRQAVAQASPRLRQLAALDAVWERMLEPREQRLLATVPGLLERRFKQLRAEHAAVHAAEGPADARRAGGWLARFEREWQDVLLAELDTRLEPIAGLVEAFQSETEGTEKYQ